LKWPLRTSCWPIRCRATCPARRLPSPAESLSYKTALSSARKKLVCVNLQRNPRPWNAKAAGLLIPTLRLRASIRGWLAPLAGRENNFEQAVAIKALDCPARRERRQRRTGRRSCCGASGHRYLCSGCRCSAQSSRSKAIDGTGTMVRGVASRRKAGDCVEFTLPSRSIDRRSHWQSRGLLR
jgi:hypothetical protein